MEYLNNLSPLFTAGIFLFAFLGGIFIIVDNKIDPLKKDIARIETRMDKLETRMDKLETRMDKIETRMAKIETRMDKIESKLDQLLAFHQAKA